MKTYSTTSWSWSRLLKIQKLVVLALTGSLFFTSCHHNDEEAKPLQNSGQGLTRPIGAPDGASVSKEIGPEGGTIVSEDGAITVVIPDGALTQLQTLTIQPITNTNIAGKNKAFRLTPHGQIFKKDVKISFSFSSEDIKRTIPEGLGVAFQDSMGVWRSMGGTQVDKTNNTITIATNHFSDWSFFEKFWLEPWAASVDLGGMVELKVMAVDPDLTAPMPKGETRGIDEPYEVKESFIKDWHLDGEGILGGMKNVQSYMAPDHIPSKNPVAVSVELNLPEAGKFLLVSNITVGNPPHINYLQVDEEFSQLFIYGSGFLQGDDNDATITIDGVPVKNIIIMTDVLIQCTIPEVGKGSSGPVVVEKNGVSSNHHILNEWNGTFIYNRPSAGNAGSLYQKIYFNVRLRGDADPDMSIPMKVDPFINESRLNKGSTAKYEAGGTGHTNYDNEEGCGSDDVIWAHTEGWVPFVYQYDEVTDDYFTGEINVKPSGFDLRLDFNANEVIPTRYSYVDCQGDGHQQDYSDEVYFIFSSYNDILKLIFKDDSSLTGGQLKANAGLAKNIHFNVWDLPANRREATLTWESIPAKYPYGIEIE